MKLIELFGGALYCKKNLRTRCSIVKSKYLEIDLLHGFGLRSRADTRDRETDVDGRSDTLVEELSLQEDLSVSDGNDVGWDVGGHVTGLEMTKTV
jgi:hypothetical protein